MLVHRPFSAPFELFEPERVAAVGGGRPAAAREVVSISAGSGSQLKFELAPPSPTLVTSIAELVKGRRSWLSVPGTTRHVRTVCEAALYELGLGAGAVEELAVAGTMQIGFGAGVSQAAMEFPWEFALAETTRPYRRPTTAGAARTAFLVYRYLDIGKQAAVDRTPDSLVVVESAPGALEGQYTFESERRLVASGIGIDPKEPLVNPDRAALEARITLNAPDVIHLAGIDAYQGAALLRREASEPGMYFAAGGEAAVLNYDTLATALTSAARKPALVAFNIYNSSLGAAAVVGKGAGAAIGFQDEVDDSLAELFFASFYSELRLSNWNLLHGFQTAWLNLGAHAAKVRGTGIVLWSSRPLLDEAAAAAPARAVTAKATPTAEIRDPDQIHDWSKYLTVEYDAPSQLNYSLLHNNTDVIPKLTIKRQQGGVYRGIGVEVRVSAGAQEAVYRTTVNLDDKAPKEDLQSSVRVPLTSDLTRTLDESMFSTVYVRVQWGRHTLFEDTRRVAFTPVDEWKYDDVNGRWLPSFVFSRDPVVREIVSASQKYLVALRDDAGAGFDGYQSFDPAGVTLAEKSKAIDAQVQAIWWALVHDYGLGYINPPPSFSDDAQRLRTPSEVIDGKRGTCIDLMLLLAALFEYIEVYPVLFLLNDHAFPGYWRSDDSYDQLRQLLTSSSPSSTGTPGAPSPTPTPLPEREVYTDVWMLGRSRFNHVVELVRKGHIVPLESVWLTSRSGFWDAADEGLKNLRSKRQFHSMYDVRTARSKSVTPIPIWGKRL